MGPLLERKRQADERALDALRQYLGALSVEATEALAATVEKATENSTSPAPDAVIQALTRRSYSDAERASLEAQTIIRAFQHRQKLLQGALTSSQVAQLLGVSRPTVNNRAERKTLLAIQDQGSLRFPLSQFDPEGPDGVVPGLPQVLQELKVSPLRALNWLQQPHPALEDAPDGSDRTPLEALKSGQLDRVIRLARSVGVT